ncbi:hypothetical protein ATI61_104649 [Archangium gephyra]|uniref:Head protein n=2 Tax=Archangium gephyra TaxID=48 RepID=A0ABX9K559_9BACT|nr:hypothetical protein [Archangium gephyra]REG33358.1 hypothetical protein ATI61_104649 [Archangium gephyra]
MDTGKLIFEALNLLGLIHEKTQSPEEKELLLTAADALSFINTTGQQYQFEDYRKDLKTEGPQMVVAAFATREEAETWLEKHSNPPHTASVLIGDDYHTVYYWRETNLRRIPASPALEFYLEELMRDGLPPPVATFNTREEARAWFYNLPERPSQAVIQLGGEPYLAAYHRNIDHLAFHPFSLVDKLKAWREKQQQEQDPEEPGPQS